MSNVVPLGWKKSRLCELADIRSSNVDKKSSDNEIPIKLCNYTDVYYNNQITSEINFMVATAKQSQIDRFGLECGDVIITKDSETPGDIAIPAYVSESLSNVLCGYHLTLIRPSKDKSSGRFLSHLFGLPTIRHHFYIMANGITRYGLNIDAIENAPIQAPPLPEQQKIAAILTSIDDVIESTLEQIAKLKDLKAGMMQELLTKGIGHTEFKDSPVGRIPVEWACVTMKEIAKITDGAHFTPTYTSEGVPFLRVTDLKNKSIFDGGIKYIPRNEHIELIKRCNPEKGDILFSKNGTIGLTRLIDWDGEFSIFVSLALIKIISKKVSSNYLTLFMESPIVKEQIRKRSKQGSVTNLHLEEIREFDIPLPNNDEQKHIVKILLSIVDKIELSENKFESLAKLKKALMQDLLTGKVRVNVN